NMYGLNSDQKVVVDKAAAISADVLASNAVVTDREARFPRASLAALANAGLYGLTIPKAHGGMGHGLRVMCAVLDEIAPRCPSTGRIYTMPLCGVSTYVASADKMSDVLRATAAGKHLSTLAFSEAGSRSQFWAPVSRARRNGKGVTLQADKSLLTS